VISYAHNAEDVVLARLFDGRNGRYVDVGAGDPTESSITKHFYDRGWRGLNIESAPMLVERLRRDRPGDVTLEIAAPRVALAAVLDEHAGPIDFMKIDVAGAEQDLVDGADWDRHRPRVVVIRATDGAPWEPTLIKAGYQCLLFDGMNRFYAEPGDAEALARLSAPANALDDFRPYQLQRELNAFAAEKAYIRRLESTLRQSQEMRAKDAEQVQVAESALAVQQRAVEKANRHLAALQNRVTELENDRPKRRTLPFRLGRASHEELGTLTKADRQAAVDAVDYWFHSVDVGDGVITKGSKSYSFSANEWTGLRLGDLTGRSVLDIGAWDGWFSFAAEDAGAARVVALDHYVWSVDHKAFQQHVADREQRGEPMVDAMTLPDVWRPDELPGKAGFNTARRLRGSKVEDVVLDFAVDDLSPLGTFDVVLFLGVLYHVVDPVGALRKVYSVTKDYAVILTHNVRIGGFEDRAFAEFFANDELVGDPTNWWTSNMKGLYDWCTAAGFRKVELALGPNEQKELAVGESELYTAIVHAYR
jgi:SAM-dependent methyltransferase